MDDKKEKKLKRVLYVERPTFARNYPDEYQVILNGLRKHYNVDARLGLDWSIPALIRKTQEAWPFDGIITHVPYDRNDFTYDRSLSILTEIRSLVSIPIIAYTGGSESLIDLIKGYVDTTVVKDFPEKDVLKMIIQGTQIC